MKNVILAAESIGVVRLAVPAISMGVYAYPAEEAVPILVEATQDALQNAISLQEVRFVLMQDSMVELFQRPIRSTKA